MKAFPIIFRAGLHTFTCLMVLVAGMPRLQCLCNLYDLPANKDVRFSSCSCCQEPSKEQKSDQTSRVSPASCCRSREARPFSSGPRLKGETCQKALTTSGSYIPSEKTKLQDQPGLSGLAALNDGVWTESGVQNPTLSISNSPPPQPPPSDLVTVLQRLTI